MTTLGEYKFTKQSVIAIFGENYAMLWPSRKDLSLSIKHACLLENETKIKFIRTGKLEVFELPKGQKSLIAWRKFHNNIMGFDFRECECFENCFDLNCDNFVRLLIHGSKGVLQ